LLKINIRVLGINTFTGLIVRSVSFNRNKNKYVEEIKIDESARSSEEGLCIYNFVGTKDMPKQGANPKA